MGSAALTPRPSSVGNKKERKKERKKKKKKRAWKEHSEKIRGETNNEHGEKSNPCTKRKGVHRAASKKKSQGSKGYNRKVAERARARERERERERERTGKHGKNKKKRYGHK